MLLSGSLSSKGPSCKAAAIEKSSFRVLVIGVTVSSEKAVSVLGGGCFGSRGDSRRRSPMSSETNGKDAVLWVLQQA